MKIAEIIEEVDYSASDQGQLKTRLEAFGEVLGERWISFWLLTLDF